MAPSTYGDDATIGGGDVAVNAGTDTAATLVLSADGSADSNDDWKINAADGGVLTIGNDASGAYVAQLTLTPHATVASSTTTIAGNCAAAGFIDSSVEMFPGDTTDQALATTGNTLLLLGGNGSNDTYTLAAGTTIGQMKRIACICDENTGCGTDNAVVTVTDGAWGGSGTITFSEISLIDLIWVTVAGPANRWMPVTSTASLG